jgi:hypothetical protein
MRKSACTSQQCTYYFRRIHAGNANAFVTRALATDDGDVPFGTVKGARQDFNQFRVSRTVHGRGGETDDQRAIAHACHFRSAGPRYDADVYIRGG